MTAMRNTPTGVGTTWFSLNCVLLRKKHPHGRGDDDPRIEVDDDQEETPPRAWGRRINKGTILNPVRNTPTGVGTTVTIFKDTFIPWKHPHGRGDDYNRAVSLPITLETPPRAWGRQYLKRQTQMRIRNTPTGVGTTPIYCERAIIKTPYMMVIAISGFQ